MSRAASSLPVPLLLAIFFSAGADAQVAAGPQALSLSLDPPRLELAAEAGGEKTESVEIANGGATKVALKIYAVPFSIDDAGQVATGRAAAGPHDASAWLRVNPGEVALEPGESAVVRLTARVPRDAAGTYWAMLFAESLPTRGGADARPALEPMSVGLRVGSYVYLQIGRAPPPSAEVTLRIAAGADGLEAVGEAVHRSGGLLRLRARWRVASASGGPPSTAEEEFVLLPGNRRLLLFRPGRGLAPADRVELSVDGPSIRLVREQTVEGGRTGR